MSLEKDTIKVKKFRVLRNRGSGSYEERIGELRGQKRIILAKLSSQSTAEIAGRWAKSVSLRQCIQITSP